MPCRTRHTTQNVEINKRTPPPRTYDTEYARHTHMQPCARSSAKRRSALYCAYVHRARGLSTSGHEPPIHPVACQHIQGRDIPLHAAGDRAGTAAFRLRTPTRHGIPRRGIPHVTVTGPQRRTRTRCWSSCRLCSSLGTVCMPYPKIVLLVRQRLSCLTAGRRALLSTRPERRS